MMNDLVFFCFSISIAIFLLGMLIMLPNFLFSTNRFKTKKSLVAKDEMKKKPGVEEVGRPYGQRHKNLGVEICSDK